MKERRERVESECFVFHYWPTIPYERVNIGKGNDSISVNIWLLEDVFVEVAKQLVSLVSAVRLFLIERQEDGGGRVVFYHLIRRPVSSFSATHPIINFARMFCVDISLKSRLSRIFGALITSGDAILIICMVCNLLRQFASR